MSHKKGIEVQNKENNNTSGTNSDAIHTVLEKDDIRIEIVNENETNVTEYTQSSVEEVISDNINNENNVFVLDYSNPRPDGQLFGTGEQNVYWGGNLNQQPPPYTEQQQSSYPTQQLQLTMQQQPPPNEGPTDRYIDAIQSEYIISFTPERRNRFIKRIMSIVLVMLLATAVFIAVVLAVPDVKYVFDNNRASILIPALMITLFVNYVETCLSPCTRYPPCNVLLLFISVVGMSLICGVLTSYFETQIVFYAFVTTTVVVFMCILLACSSFDFTSYLLYIIVIVTTFGALTLVVLTALIMANIELRPTFLGFLIVSTLLEVILFTIHLQTIIGGKRVVLREEDYALGAYMLYMSILDIFVKMICMFGISSDM